MSAGRSSSAAAFAVSLARYCDAGDDITASFEPIEPDDACGTTKCENYAKCENC